MKTWIRGVAAVGVGGLLLGGAGCRNGRGGDDALVRLINAAPDVEDLSVAVDGQRVWKHSEFRSGTHFDGVGQGAYQVDLTAQQGGQRLTARNYIQCQKGRAYTFVAYGQGEPGGAPGLRVFIDPRRTVVPPGKTRLRLINVAGDLGNVDVLFNNIVGLPGVAAGARSGALLLDAGTYDFKVVEAGGENPVIGPLRIGCQAGRSYTLVLMGRRGAAVGGSQSLSLIAYPDAQ